MSGVDFFIPFLEKLKLYQMFFKRKSFWNKNKNDYWKHEKAILHWAWSEKHQHLARNLDSKRIRHVYGINKIEEPNSKFRYALNSPNPVELQLEKKQELVEDMLSNGCRLIEPIMGNLYQKGFAAAISYGDLAQKYAEVGELEKSKNLLEIDNATNNTVHSIVINTKGLLVGELVDEEDRNLLWKYKLALFFIYNLFLFILLAVVFATFKQFTDYKLLIPFNLDEVFKQDWKNFLTSLILSSAWVSLFWINL